VRFKLKEYQAEAVALVLERLERASDDYREHGDKIAFALSATTGAGKTVMATAVLEALLDGSEEFDFDADPTAVVLWVTDDPSLNEQTRYRILESGDALDESRLKVIESGFVEERLDPGNVYFLNIQKLASGTTFTEKADNRPYTLWESIANTIDDPSTTLYLVLDEAHRGMRSDRQKQTAERDRTTIVQRLINGHNGLPAAPIVWGISATVQRFIDAMSAAQAEGRITYPAVAVDAKEVQESGLLKDTIVLDFPDEKGAFETTLLRRGLREMREISELWAAYAEQEDVPDPVLPLLVLQVPNTPKQRELATLLEVIGEEWPDALDDGIANVFGEHTELTIGEHRIPYVAPQDVEDATGVRVLLAKDAISTGWDCPRAEVLFSLRPATDRTHITQLLGRMVRTPLARRVESDERLNSVSCYLPFFDRVTATDVAMILTGEKEESAQLGFVPGTGRKALTSPLTMSWNEALPKGVMECFSGLPSEAAPKAAPKPIKRLLSLAAEIAVDELMDHSDEKAREALFAVLDGQLAQHKKAVEAEVKEIYTADLRRITTSMGEGSLVEETHRESADYRAVDDAFRPASRALGAAVANAYTKRLALEAAGGKEDQIDIHDGKTKVAALLSIEGVGEAVDAEAEKLANGWLARLRAKIRGLGEDRQAVYSEIKQQAREPQEIDIVAPKSRIENTRDSDDVPLATRKHHLLADEKGDFPVGSGRRGDPLNEWEVEVLDAELARDDTVAWYRNPSNAGADALQIPYVSGEKWKPMQPDFIAFSKRKNGSIGASIVDPHGHHLSDALPKLRGLCRFAERYGDRFIRIEAIAKIDRDGLRMLDLKDADVRKAIGDEESVKALYESELAVAF
jgi:type III restriction enzyme